MPLKNLAKFIDSANQEKTPEQEFLHIYNETIQRIQKPRKPSKTYKPSSLGGCMRTMYYEVTGAPQDENQKIDSNFIEIMNDGTDRHERIQETIIEAGKLGYDLEWIDVGEFLERRPVPGTRVTERQGYETKLRNDVLNLSFMCDGIIKFKSKYYILEIKTEVSFKWNGRVGPVDKHEVQAAAYSTALGVDDILYIYENRDFKSKKIFTQHVTPQDKEEKVVSKIETCNAYVEAGIVPPCTCTQGEKRYDRYKEQSKKDGPTREEDIIAIEGAV